MATFGNPTRAAAQFDFGNYYQMDGNTKTK